MSDELYRALLDPSAPIPSNWPHGMLGTFLLFLVPIGGGIPAGVLMGRNWGVPIPVMALLYLASDMVLACVFEPMLRGLRLIGRHVPAVGRAARTMIDRMRRTVGPNGATHPLGLVAVSFGVDPMTGRAAAAMAGHGFFAGWAIAIAGDMLYFGVLMASTLWLDGILGDARYTIVAVLVLMMVIPAVVRRWRERHIA
ncbi:MAG TPA: hypothetical protein VGR62_03330 [Candidatus Binatia bacterium]|jgi:hypothetical protein|nr:hypothetical protein [Candidatus Binatia bacterium]